MIDKTNNDRSPTGPSGDAPEGPDGPSFKRIKFLRDLAKRRKSSPYAFIAIIFLIIGFAIYLILTAAPNHGIPWHSFSFVKEKIEKLNLGGLSTGITLKEMRRLYPELTLKGPARGPVMAVFVKDDKQYVLWFKKPNDTAKAYRVRYRYELTGVKEEDVLFLLGQKFGRPATSECSRNRQNNIDTCTWQWWVADGISVQGQSRTNPADKGQRIVVILTAEDAYLSGKKKRSGRK